MKILDTPISGLKIIQPNIFNDERGYFFESFNLTKFVNSELNYNFIQDNESKSCYGVVRGLHYQLEPYSQAKLVRVIKGYVLDVAVDLRKDSPTYTNWYSVELNEENKYQLLIPRGFAHGFSVLSDDTIFAYKCDNVYNKDSERGIRFDDLAFNIKWRIDKPIVSEKDRNLPLFTGNE